MAKLLDWSALLAYCALIYGLSAQETLPVPEVFALQDKFLHLGAYFVMAILSWRAFRHLQINAQTLAWAGFLFCSLYGVSDEWHQSFVLGRTASIWDWLADSLGGALACYLILKFNLKQSVN